MKMAGANSWCILSDRFCCVAVYRVQLNHENKETLLFLSQSVSRDKRANAVNINVRPSLHRTAVIKPWCSVFLTYVARYLQRSDVICKYRITKPVIYLICGVGKRCLFKNVAFECLQVTPEWQYRFWYYRQSVLNSTPTQSCTQTIQNDIT